jgi:hypothetical protein
MSDDSLDLMVCSLPPVALVVWAFKYGITFPTSWAGVGYGLAAVGAVVVVAGVLLLLAGHTSRGGGQQFARDMHPNGWSMASTRRHENGHANVGRALGCSMQVVLDDGRGNAYTRIVSGPPLRPAELAAIAYGGEAAAGSGGCGTDRRNAEAALSRLPWPERGRARSEAWRIARRYA